MDRKNWFRIHHKKCI